MGCRMSVHAYSIYHCIYTGNKKLPFCPSADRRLAPECHDLLVHAGSAAGTVTRHLWIIGIQFARRRNSLCYLLWDVALVDRGAT